MPTQVLEKPLIIDYPVALPAVTTEYPTADEIVELFKKHNLRPVQGRLVGRMGELQHGACAAGAIAVDRHIIRPDVGLIGLPKNVWEENNIDFDWIDGLQFGFDDFRKEAVSRWGARSDAFFTGWETGREVQKRVLGEVK